MKEMANDILLKCPIFPLADQFEVNCVSTSHNLVDDCLICEYHNICNSDQDEKILLKKGK